MTWKTAENRLGQTNIAGIDKVQAVPLGTIVRAWDPTYGEGEFIYLRGTATSRAGLAVTYDGASYATTHLGAGDAESGVPVAVAMSAAGASEFGWFQIGGQAQWLKTAVELGDKVPIYISGTAGRIKAVASSGKGIIGARTVISVVAAVSATTVMLNRPAVAGFES